MLINTTIKEAPKQLAALKKPANTHITIIIEETDKLEVDDRTWEKSFAASPDLLEAMADEARKEHQQGKTIRMEWD